MKRLFYSIPMDIHVAVLLTLIVAFCGPSLIPAFEGREWILFILLVLYVLSGGMKSIIKHGTYSFLINYSPIWSRRRIFISTAKTIFKSSDTKHNLENASSSYVFLYELYHLNKKLPEGTICSCCTHDDYLKVIQKKYQNTKSKYVGKGSLKKERKVLGLKDNNEKKAFYKVSFVVQK